MPLKRVWPLDRSLRIVTILLVALVPASSASGQTLRIYHIDVEQGDATLIVTPSGKTLLVDSGKNGHGKRIHAVMQQAVADGRLSLPAGYYWEWSGQFQNQVRATARMRILVPVTLFIMFVMLYLGFKRWWIAPVIFFGVLVSASGGFMMLALWGANLSVAVWVGFLVLFGVVDDDGVVIATYLEGTFKDRAFESIAEIRAAVIDAGLKRIRPCLMTIATTVFGLMPIFWATGRGSDVMQPMAIPVVGGMAVSLITLFIVPCVFCAVEEWKWKRIRG